MPKLDPPIDSERGWKAMDKFIAAETNEKHRVLLETVQEHMRTEIRGEHEALMATLVDEPEYHMWGGPMDGGPKGRKAVSEFYQAMFDANGQNFEFEVRKVIVDDNGVVTEGVLRTAMAGSAVLAGGVEEVEGESVDADGTYVNEGQLLTVWPAGEGGKLVGEDIYFGTAGLGKLVRWK
ncbi:MAG: nuclear transport factor 2 family protein [Gammaproteobacteria bacterium]|nr:nuclear transport factor 2 family protein [Gammaproteobacteria bacterium]